MQWQIDALAQTDNRCDAQTRHILENAWNEMKHGALVTGLADCRFNAGTFGRTPLPRMQ